MLILVPPRLPQPLPPKAADCLPSNELAHHSAAALRPLSEPSASRQITLISLALGVLFLASAGQLARLAVKAESMPSVMAAMVEPLTMSYSRPDIVDRNGRLLATDVEVHSLYADPSRVIDADETVEKLAAVLRDLDEPALRRALSEKNRHFAWVRRALTPKQAQQVHDLGLPGLSFRREMRRAYPLGAMAGHLLGRVDGDNKGVAGIERHIDDNVGIDGVHNIQPTERPAVRLSIEIGAQAGLEAELTNAMAVYRASGAAAVVIDVATGEIAAAASFPRIDPARAADATDNGKRDKLQRGVYELGSIFKILTVAAALDSKQVQLDTLLDVRVPLTAGRHEIKDKHSLGRPLTVSEVFLQSSNVGSGMLALEAGAAAQKAFLARAGLLSAMKTEVGPVALPDPPRNWQRAETITVSYGHGLSVAPLQFAAAAAALVNGGELIAPTYLARRPSDAKPQATRLIEANTSAAIRTLMRANVTDALGTGKRADVAGFEIGGKTGTAEIGGPRGYRQGGVISSFVAAFPMSHPRYLALVMLFEPKPTAQSGGKVLASLTAAPVAAKVITRIGPLLDR